MVKNRDPKSKDTVPETNSSHLKIGRLTTQEETKKSSNHPFSGAKMLVSGRVSDVQGSGMKSSRLESPGKNITLPSFTASLPLKY